MPGQPTLFPKYLLNLAQAFSSLSSYQMLCAFLIALCSLLLCSGTTPDAHAAVPMRIDYTDSSGIGFNDVTLGPRRRTAFEAAVTNWSQRLNGSVPIVIDAAWDILGASGDTLARGGASTFVSNFVGATLADTDYPIALGNQLAGVDLNGENDELTIRFNTIVDTPQFASEFGGNFYYGTNGSPGSNFDFYTIALHELGHGLGFEGNLTIDGLFIGGTPAIYDRFLANGPEATALLLTTLTETERSNAQSRNSVYFQGPNARAANEQFSGGNVKLFSIDPVRSESAVYHLDESIYTGINDLMTPIIPIGTAVHDPGPVATGIYKDLGWIIVAAGPPPVFVSNTNDSGPGSLRQAILLANARPGPDTVRFNISRADPNFRNTVFTISPTTPLPPLADGTTLDGLTQTDFIGNTNPSGPEVVISGAAAGSNTHGFTITGSACVIRGLVINGFSRAGILVSGSNNRVESCFIGTNATGTAAVPNDVGVEVAPGSQSNVLTQNNQIGGSSPETGNVISGNRRNGVFLSGPVTKNVVQGNFIGTNVAGTTAIANTIGVNIQAGANNNTVGGTNTANRNVISGNGTGINIGGANTNDNLVQGNYIGTNAAGISRIPNNFGIIILGGSNVLGGTVAGARNVISGNSIGASISGVGNLVQGNFIGPAADGSRLGNSLEGIFLVGALNSLVNGRNRIAYNQIGIRVSDGTGNRISENSIFSNTKLGLDLRGGSEDGNGVTANDIGDGDIGSNRLQNYPIISEVTTQGSTTTIRGTLNSTPDSTYIIDFYVNRSSTLGGLSEGQDYLGAVRVTTNSSGNASFVFFAGQRLTGQTITATATNNTTGDTSEFSALGAVSSGKLQFSAGNYTIDERGGNATITVTRASSDAGAVTVNYTTSNGTATAGSDYRVASGQLAFADREVSKTFTIPIIDDGVAEGNETIQLTLSNPVGGASLGAPSTAVLTIVDNDTPTLTVRITPEVISEGATAIGIVTRNTATTGPLTVSLSSSNLAKIAVPTTVTIPAGRVAVNFTIVASNNTVADGSKAVFINATATGFTTGNATITVTDNEPNTLNVTVTPTILNESPGRATARGTVQRTGSTAAALQVRLSSSNMAAAKVPPSVIIPVGARTVDFPVVSVDNNLVDGTRRVTITASAANNPSSQAGIMVTDNDRPALTLSISPTSFAENIGNTAVRGTITRNTPTTSSLVVTLRSSDTTEASVPATVTIPAGATSATFLVRAVNDTIVDGFQRVTITASVRDYINGTAIITVTDDERATSVARSLSVASNVSLSTATASAASSSVQLWFSNAVNAESASNPGHYIVQINGRAVAVESASYNRTTHRADLSLPEPTLRTGDAVTVKWINLVDASGRTVPGQISSLTAQ